MAVLLHFHILLVRKHWNDHRHCNIFCNATETVTRWEDIQFCKWPRALEENWCKQADVKGATVTGQGVEEKRSSPQDKRG